MPEPKDAPTVTEGMGALRNVMPTADDPRQRDVRMVGRAIREGWLAPDAPKRWGTTGDGRKSVADAMLDLVTKEGIPPATKIAAARNYIACEAQNQGDDHQVASMEAPKDRNAGVGVGSTVVVIYGQGQPPPDSETRTVVVVKNEAKPTA